jgi:hypothetical protein
VTTPAKRKLPRPEDKVSGAPKNGIGKHINVVSSSIIRRDFIPSMPYIQVTVIEITSSELLRSPHFVVNFLKTPCIMPAYICSPVHEMTNLVGDAHNLLLTRLQLSAAIGYLLDLNVRQVTPAIDATPFSHSMIGPPDSNP